MGLEHRELYFLVPARKGSTRLPGKNFANLSGAPLFMWSILFALQHTDRNRVILSTDDERLLGISELVSDFRIVSRSPEVSHASASTESWLRELVRGCSLQRSDLVVLQPTSPFRSAETLKKLIDTHQRDRTRGVFSYSHSNKRPNGNLYALSSDVEICDGYLGSPDRASVKSANDWESIDIDYQSDLDGALETLFSDPLQIKITKNMRTPHSRSVLDRFRLLAPNLGS